MSIPPQCVEAQASPLYHRTGKGWPGCPRCAEVPGAGVCPRPGTLEDVMLLFNRTAILCHSKNCERHRPSAKYWSADVYSRLEIFEATRFDHELERRVYGSAVGELLGLRGKFARDPQRSREFIGAWHRVRALLATLEVVHWAEQQGLDSVLVMEGDVRPVPRNQLNQDEVQVLRARLQSAESRWSVVRLGGYFHSFSRYRGRVQRDPSISSACPTECACSGGGRAAAMSEALSAAQSGAAELTATHPLTKALPRPRLCEVAAPAATDGAWNTAPFCNVKDSVAFAVHRSAYPTFRRARRLAVAALRLAANRSKSAYRRPRRSLPAGPRPVERGGWARTSDTRTHTHPPSPRQGHDETETESHTTLTSAELPEVVPANGTFGLSPSFFENFLPW